MAISPGKIICERWRFLCRIYGRITVAVSTAVYAGLSLYSWAAGEFASTRVQRDLTLGNHLPRWSG